MKRAEYYILCPPTDNPTVTKVKGWLISVADNTGNRYDIGVHNIGVKKWVATHLETGLKIIGGESVQQISGMIGNIDLTVGVKVAIKRYKAIFERLKAQEEEQCQKD